MVLLHFGNMQQETVRYNTELFAREVMPKLSGLFSDWEDDVLARHRRRWHRDDLAKVTLWDPPITAKVYEQGDGEPVLFLHSGSGITPSDPLVAALAASAAR